MLQYSSDVAQVLNNCRPDFPHFDPMPRRIAFSIDSLKHPCIPSEVTMQSEHGVTSHFAIVVHLCIGALVHLCQETISPSSAWSIRVLHASRHTSQAYRCSSINIIQGRCDMWYAIMTLTICEHENPLLGDSGANLRSKTLIECCCAFPLQYVRYCLHEILDISSHNKAHRQAKILRRSMKNTVSRPSDSVVSYQLCSNRPNDTV